MSETTTTGDRLKKVRKDIGLTQVQFADFLEISRTTLFHYENDERLMDARVLAGLRNLFAVDLNWLLTGAPTPPYTNAIVTARETQLLQIIKSLPDDARQHLLAFLSSVSKPRRH